MNTSPPLSPDDCMIDTLLPLLMALCAAPLALLAGALRPAWAARSGAALAALAFAATLWGWVHGGAGFDLPWAPSWGLRLAFALDGLAALYALLATGVGCLVLTYAAAYMPHHLEEQGRPAGEQTRFVALMLLFMGAMVGMVMAQDLVLLFVFWDLTAIASYFLIGYDRQLPAAREAALMALLVTGVSALGLLIGALLLYIAFGSASIPVLLGQARPGWLTTMAGGLILLAALAKSAQVPLHFWLPRAMAAPTPVSAYLHSAAMVASGVFLIGRLYPLLSLNDVLLDIMFGVGLVSILLGGLLALASDTMKRLLAYSTIAQYGYVLAMFGLGGAAGVAGATFYVLAHALLKCALFLTAGAITEATGERKLSRLGGLRRELPALAVASGLAAAGLAGAPLTIGFFKDELFFAAALERGWPVAALAVLSAASTAAYAWRFWSGIFLGRRRAAPEPLAPALVLPIALLAGLALLGGLLPGLFARLAEAAAAATYARELKIELAYHLDARPANLMALAAYALGAGLALARPRWGRSLGRLNELAQQIGPEHWYLRLLAALNHFSHRLLRLERRDLRSRVAAVLLPTAALIGLGVSATPTQGTYRLGTLTATDLPLILCLLVAATAALVSTRPRNHLALALALSFVGFSLAAVFAGLGAPDVALVAVLVETLLTPLLLGCFALFPPEALSDQERREPPPSVRRRNIGVSLAAGGGAFVVVWGVLSRPAAATSVAAEYIRLTPDAHGRDVVTVILADFRGLDTLGEITVIAVALLGIASLIARQERRR